MKKPQTVLDGSITIKYVPTVGDGGCRIRITPDNVARGFKKELPDRSPRQVDWFLGEAHWQTRIRELGPTLRSKAATSRQHVSHRSFQNETSRERRFKMKAEIFKYERFK